MAAQPLSHAGPKTGFKALPLKWERRLPAAHGRGLGVGHWEIRLFLEWEIVGWDVGGDGQLSGGFECPKEPWQSMLMEGGQDRQGHLGSGGSGQTASHSSSSNISTCLLRGLERPVGAEDLATVPYPRGGGACKMSRRWPGSAVISSLATWSSHPALCILPPGHSPAFPQDIAYSWCGLGQVSQAVFWGCYIPLALH